MPKRWAPRMALLSLVPLAACATAPTEDLVARARNDFALRDGTPAAADVIVENGRLYEVPTLDDAFANRPEDRHRYVFAPGEEGERDFTLAYLPPGGTVAGDAFLDALGIEAHEDARGAVTLVRGGRSVTADESRAVPVDLLQPGGYARRRVAVTVDPDARGSLLLPRRLALGLGAPLSAIPGTTHVEVALGRPFAAHRARLLVAVPDLGAEDYVEIAYPAPPGGPAR